MGLVFIYPALHTCLVVYVQKSDFHLINVFRVVIVVKNCKLLCLAQVVFYILYRIAARYLWCLQLKLRICTACCSDSQMELIVYLEESILGLRSAVSVLYGC